MDPMLLRLAKVAYKINSINSKPYSTLNYLIYLLCYSMGYNVLVTGLINILFMINKIFLA